MMYRISNDFFAVSICQTSNFDSHVDTFPAHWNYNEADMVILTDDSTDMRRKPTKANITSAMLWLVQGAQPNDSLFFHCESHKALYFFQCLTLTSQTLAMVDKPRSAHKLQFSTFSSLTVSI